MFQSKFASRFRLNHSGRAAMQGLSWTRNWCYTDKESTQSEAESLGACSMYTNILAIANKATRWNDISRTLAWCYAIRIYSKSTAIATAAHTTTIHDLRNNTTHSLTLIDPTKGSRIKSYPYPKPEEKKKEKKKASQGENTKAYSSCPSHTLPFSLWIEVWSIWYLTIPLSY